MKEPKEPILPHIERFVSFFKFGITDTTPYKDIKIGDILKAIKGDTFKKAILEYREVLAVDEELARSHYKEKLPYFTVSGVFKKPRSNRNLVHHSGLIQIDIDASKNTILDLDLVKNTLYQDKYTMCGFDGPSGDGVKLIVKIPVAKNDTGHKQSFAAIEQYYLDEYGLVIDSACKDVSRPFFVSHDPTLFLNEDSIIFEEKIVKPKNTSPKESTNNASVNTANIIIKNPNKVVEKKVRQKIENAINLIRNATDGEKNEKLLKASQILGGLVGGGFLNHQEAHDIAYTEIQQKPNVKSLDGASKTIKNGLEWGSKHAFTEESILTSYTDYLASIGIQSNNGASYYNPPTHSQTNGQSKNGLSNNGQANKQPKQVNSIIKKGQIERKVRPAIKEYSISYYTKSAKKIIEAIYYIIDQGYARDVHTNNIYQNGVAIKQSAIEELVLYCKGNFETPIEDCLRIIASDYMPYIDCVLDLEDACKESTGYEDSIDALFDSLDLSEPSHEKLLRGIFKKWFIGFWANLVGEKPEDVNQLFLILSGDNTLGKSYFFKQMFYEIGLEDKSAILQEDQQKNINDLKRFSRESFFCLFDDFEKTLFKNDYFFKNILSNRHISMVEKFQKNSQNYKRIANFAGTTNEKEFLYDTTFNRRIIPINIKGRNKAKYDKVNKINVFAEAYHLYKAGESHQITDEEMNFIKTELSPANKVNDFVEDVILSRFEPGTKESHTEHLLPSEFYQKFDSLKISLIEFGRIINKIGFKDSRKKKNGLWGYYLTQIEPKYDEPKK